jgi:hypothetical protein
METGKALGDKAFRRLPTANVFFLSLGVLELNLHV